MPTRGEVGERWSPLRTFPDIVVFQSKSRNQVEWEGSEKTMTADLQAVLFDVDGTLVLSNDAHAQAFSEAMKEAGYDVPPDKIWPLIGLGGKKLVQKLLPQLSTEEADKLGKREGEIFLQDYLQGVQPAPGARALLEFLQQQGLRTAIATSAEQKILDALLQKAHVEDLIHAATTASDVSESKPAPNVLDATLEQLHLRPEQTVFVGDTPYDIESGQNAHVLVIGVRCGGWDDEQLKGAIAVYADPEDMLRHYSQSPLTHWSQVLSGSR